MKSLVLNKKKKLTWHQKKIKTLERRIKTLESVIKHVCKMTKITHGIPSFVLNNTGLDFTKIV